MDAVTGRRREYDALFTFSFGLIYAVCEFHYTILNFPSHSCDRLCRVSPQYSQVPA